MKLEERVEKLEKENKKLKKFLEVIKKTFCLICKFLKGDKESSDLSFDDGELKEKLEICNKTKQQIEQENNEYKKQIERLESLHRKFAKFEELKNLYNKLSKETKKSLENVFFGNEALIYASGIKNFSSLWDMAKTLRSEKKEDFYVLKEILEILFDDFSKIDGVIKVEPQGVFDELEMFNDYASTSKSGKIKEVVLFGYKKQKIIKKPIVRISND